MVEVGKAFHGHARAIEPAEEGREQRFGCNLIIGTHQMRLRQSAQTWREIGWVERTMQSAYTMVGGPRCRIEIRRDTYQPGNIVAARSHQRGDSATA